MKCPQFHQILFDFVLYVFEGDLGLQIFGRGGQLTEIRRLPQGEFVAAFGDEGFVFVVGVGEFDVRFDLAPLGLDFEGNLGVEDLGLPLEVDVLFHLLGDHGPVCPITLHILKL